MQPRWCDEAEAKRLHKAGYDTGWRAGANQLGSSEGPFVPSRGYLKRELDSIHKCTVLKLLEPELSALEEEITKIDFAPFRESASKE